MCRASWSSAAGGQSGGGRCTAPPRRPCSQSLSTFAPLAGPAHVPCARHAIRAPIRRHLPPAVFRVQGKRSPAGLRVQVAGSEGRRCCLAGGHGVPAHLRYPPCRPALQLSALQTPVAVVGLIDAGGVQQEKVNVCDKAGALLDCTACCMSCRGPAPHFGFGSHLRWPALPPAARPGTLAPAELTAASGPPLRPQTGCGSRRSKDWWPREVRPACRGARAECSCTAAFNKPLRVP